MYYFKKITMNPYYYLFYKLSQFINKKGNNLWGVIFALSVLVCWNIVIIYIKVLSINLESFQSSYKYGFWGICMVIYITNNILFLNKKRIQDIMNSYKGESERKKKFGNILTILYVILSLGLIVLI